MGNKVWDEKCSSCHGMTKKVVGPSFAAVTAKYKGDAKAEAHLMSVIKNGGGCVWGVFMPAQGKVKDSDVRKIVEWVLTGK
jgi:cytochrome c551/c552